MALGKLYITGVEGQAFVQHQSLAYVEILLATRECKPLVETTDTPTGRRFKHIVSEGKVVLDADTPILMNNSDRDWLVYPEQFYFEFKSN